MASAELTACKAAYNQGNYGHFFDLLEKKPDIVSSPIFSTFKKEIGKSAQNDTDNLPLIIQKQIIFLLQKVKFWIDSPSNRDVLNHFIKILVNIEEILNDEPDLYSEEITQQLDWIHLSIANHTGNITMGNSVWTEFEKHFSLYEKDTPENLLAYQTEMVLRRVVNLMDTFHYDKAVDLLNDITKKQEAIHQYFQNCDLFSFKAYRPKLGYCWSSFGQIAAFRAISETDYKTACEYFKKSLKYYDTVCNREDIERSRIYIGHVAIDAGHHQYPWGKALWDETRQLLNMPSFLDKKQDIFDTMIENRFWLALLIKGIFVFGTTDEVSLSLKVLKDSNVIHQKVSETNKSPELVEHPWALIFQSIALLFVRQFHDTGIDSERQLALKYFDRAIAIMEAQNGDLFQILSLVAKLRRTLFVLEGEHNSQTKSELETLYNEVKAQLVITFGEQAWQEHITGHDSGYIGSRIKNGESVEANAKRVIDGIMFNYW